MALLNLVHSAPLAALPDSVDPLTAAHAHVSALRSALGGGQLPSVDSLERIARSITERDASDDTSPAAYVERTLVDEAAAQLTNTAQTLPLYPDIDEAVASGGRCVASRVPRNRAAWISALMPRRMPRTLRTSRQNLT